MTDHESAAVCPAEIVEGVAMKLKITGADACEDVCVDVCTTCPVICCSRRASSMVSSLTSCSKAAISGACDVVLCALTKIGSESESERHIPTAIFFTREEIMNS